MMPKQLFHVKALSSFMMEEGKGFGNDDLFFKSNLGNIKNGELKKET